MSEPQFFETISKVGTTHKNCFRIAVLCRSGHAGCAELQLQQTLRYAVHGLMPMLQLSAG